MFRQSLGKAQAPTDRRYSLKQNVILQAGRPADRRNRENVAQRTKRFSLSLTKDTGILPTIKRPAHSPPSSAEVKNECRYTSTSPHVTIASKKTLPLLRARAQKVAISPVA